MQSTPVGAITRYEDRKNTFIGHWSLNHRESATFLAKAGFSLLADQPDEEDPIKIKCYQCEVEIYVDDEKNTIQVHQDTNPNCPLIQLRNTFSNELSNIEEPEEPNIVEENLTIQVEGGLQNNDPEVQPAETVPSQEENQSRGSQDRVVNDLNQSDSELENTQNNREPTNQSYQVEYQIPAQVDTENDNIVGPVPSTSSQYYDQTHSIKSDPDKRLGTFQTDECPLILRILRRNLVDSGLYYTGDADIVRCFLCNILLGDWRTNHEPWQRHALSSQNLGGVCRYVRETKSQNHLNRFLKRQRECNTCSHPPKIARIGP
ncbi:hypothetical protein B566_EDAN012559 [Ephemera danica]|nr:hypothetical protein B566_EDAN012559 [Ephemera danica]